MTLREIMVGVGGLSFAILVLGYVSAPADENGATRESRTTIALAGVPFVLRDGRQAVADVLQVAFEPQAVTLSEEAQRPLQELLSQMARGCVLSAQVVGAASEFETAPRPVVAAHLLALERADAIAQLARDSGVPTTAVASLWTVDRGLQVPHSVLWVFSSTSISACTETSTSSELAAVPVEAAPGAGLADEMVANPPMPRPQRDRPAPAGQAATEVPPAASVGVTELALTFADNSSYLGDQDIARLRRFARSLGSACMVTLRATVAGGTDAHYAAWLAERRIARVADHLSELVTVENHVLVRDDASRRVRVAVSDKSACAGGQETTSAMIARP